MKFYRRIEPIKAMTFDLDDTLYDNYPVIVRMERELLAWLKHHHPAVA
ncbi:5-amino-6-(5-phospho-D-ribitylamino)uracil phosphatase YigB, partial [Escherichia coli]|nr:5-amino-6-(5-phospho-D-ribitylamino)uracil phosphatase YigB [Escherichia coli]